MYVCQDVKRHWGVDKEENFVGPIKEIDECYLETARKKREDKDWYLCIKATARMSVSKWWGATEGSIKKHMSSKENEWVMNKSINRLVG